MSTSTSSNASTGTSTAVGPDELSEEDLKLAAETQASSGDWHDGPPPGKAEAFWPSFKRMVGLLGAHRISLVVVALAAVGTVVLAVAAPKVLGQATNVIFEGVVSTITEADQILVLDGGHLVGSGTHTELLATCSVYREIVTSQLGAEAAA